MPEFQDRLQEALGTTYRLETELGGGGVSRVWKPLWGNPKFEALLASQGKQQ